MLARSISKPALGIGLGIGLIALLLGLTPPATNVENQVFDLFMRWQVDPAKWPKDVVILLVDETSMQEINTKTGWRWPWRRDAYAGLVAYLTKAEARAIVFDILFCEETDAFYDDSFAAAIQAAKGRVVLATYQRPEAPAMDPAGPLKQAVGPRVGFVNAPRDTDGVVRHCPLRDRWAHSDRKPLAVMAAGKDSIQIPTGPVMTLRWLADTDQLIDRQQVLPVWGTLLKGLEWFDAAQKVAKIDVIDPQQVETFVRQRPMPEGAERFRDKIVFIGCAAGATHDPIATPLNKHQPGVLMNATALANLMRGDYLVPVDAWMRGLFLLLVAAAVTVVCVRTTQIRWQVGLTVLVLVLTGVVSHACFSKNFWLPPVMAMVAGAGSFTGVTTWQYFTEGKQKRWMRQLFSDFVSPDVLEELQLSPGGLSMRGETRMGTVLFCDLEGFTTFTERAPPDQFVDAMNAYFSEASKLLLARKAYIDKFIGDCVMAVFGIPKPQPDHAVQACLSALELQGMMGELNERLGKQYNIKLGLRVGINSGEMIAGAIGYARKLNYTVMNDIVNQASRFEGANKKYHTRIMIGPLTQELARNAVETRLLDFLRVKGKEKPVEVYEVMARKGGMSSKQASLITVYTEGIEHYERRRWKEALACFERALTIIPGDGPSEEYRSRCAYYIENPPADNWDGSFGLDHK